LRLAVVLTGAVAISLLITAPQWITSFFAFTESYRLGEPQFLGTMERSFNPVRLVELFLPHAFGTHGQWFGTALAGAGAIKTTPWTSSFHVGLLPLLAIWMAMRKRKRPLVKWSLIVLFISLLLSFGRFIPGASLWRYVPILGSFRYPEKYLLWSTLSLSVLAAYGIDSLRGLWHSVFPIRYRRQLLGWWTVTILAFGIIGIIIAHGVSVQEISTVRWLATRFSASGLFVLLILFMGIFTRLIKRPWILGMLLILDLLLPWNTEQPTTTQFDPLSPPIVASAIINSDSPRGRFLRDPATMHTVPLPDYFYKLNQSEQEAVFYRESLAFNSPRIWGMSTVGGFSPLEPAAMRQLRLQSVLSESGNIPPIRDFANFCRLAGVEWVLTTQDRAQALLEEGIEAETVSTWAGTPSLLLLRIKGIALAEFTEVFPKQAHPPTVRDMWRQDHGKIRIDLSPGATANLTVKETYARGWRAWNERGNLLSVKSTPAGFISISVPSGTIQVRLQYKPPLWHTSVILGILGLLIIYVLFVVAVGNETVKRWIKSPSSIAIVACILFLGVGFTARNQWACTFDEGFHITRGLARLKTGDSRLSYYHPPLQNVACAYFASLACGEYIRMPNTPGWQTANIFRYSTELAIANRDIFPKMIRASRWGTSLFGLLLCSIGTIWAFRAAGPVAAWLAALGLSLNPTVLAHGNLTTSDMSVTALIAAGSFGLWFFGKASRQRTLLWTSICFALAAVAKYTGLIWFGIYALVCIPILAVNRRNPKLLWFVPISVVCIFLFLLVLYGPTPQIIRVEHGSWWHDKPALIAGRYIEGIIVQSKHAIEGHRSFFAGQQFTKGSWWHFLATIALKTPLPWFFAMAGAVCYYSLKRRSYPEWIPWLPAISFFILLCTSNRILTGVRHMLPIIVLAIIGTAIWVAQLSLRKLRIGIMAILLSSSVLTAALTFPHFISYFPRPFGGISAGYRWLVDSNYDWGQDIERLENVWAHLTYVNNGRPLKLLYFGFVDPRYIYRMPVKADSLCGFMGQTLESVKEEDSYRKWLAGLKDFEGTTVASISAIELNPYGVNLSGVRNGKFLGQISNSFFIYHSSESSEKSF